MSDLPEQSTQRSATPHCSALARADGATLVGTAESVDVWLLLEYAAAWRPKAVTDNALSPKINAWLASAVRRIENDLQLNARVQFIRQPERAGLAPQLLIVRSGEATRAVYQFILNDYDALLAVDPVATVRGEPGQSGELIDVPIYLVCTHGQRDRCCARFGTPVYAHLAQIYGASVWQTTHIGGHRYAPNLVCLPEGLIYGFADPDIAVELVDAARQGEIVLRQLRGRTCFPSYVQVAEHAARRRTGTTFIDALRLSGDRDLGNDTWRVTFEVAGRGRIAVTVKSAAPIEVQASCGDGQMKRIDQYVALDEAAGA